ncbi:hypothetical protein Tco_1203378 [Tanacetum coccineum]
MDKDSAHMVAASKVHMLKPGEYELWRMRMEQYIQMIDYSLWEVIENGNAPPITKVVEGVETIIAPTTANKFKKLFRGFVIFTCFNFPKECSLFLECPMLFRVSYPIIQQF